MLIPIYPSINLQLRLKQAQQGLQMYINIKRSIVHELYTKLTLPIYFVRLLNVQMSIYQITNSQIYITEQLLKLRDT